MAQDGYPADPRVWKSFKDIEDDAVHRARFTVFTTPGAARMYQERYPEVAAERMQVIENGYDEASFAALDATVEAGGPLVPGRLTLLHSGALYPSERDPTRFFDALARLKRSGRVRADRVAVRFRASSYDELLRELARQRDIEDLVELEPPVAYRQALEEMCRADGLLVLQAANCNQQIPAKLYEYLRAGRPVLGLTDPAGDTAATMRRCGATDIAPLDAVDRIEATLARWIDEIEAGTARRPPRANAQANTRTARAAELATLLDQACAEGADRRVRLPAVGAAPLDCEGAGSS
jgi:glycosyltransferase involved in cell wall biosynthesis